MPIGMKHYKEVNPKEKVRKPVSTIQGRKRKMKTPN